MATKSAKPAKKAPPKLAVKSKAKPAAKPPKIEANPTPKIMSAQLPAATKPAGKVKASKTVGAVAAVAKATDTGVEKADPEWVQLRNQNKDTTPMSYSMANDYPPKTVLNHKIWGLGFVVKNQNNRIEVQFKDGLKILITNYKK